MKEYTVKLEITLELEIYSDDTHIQEDALADVLSYFATSYMSVKAVGKLVSYKTTGIKIKTKEYIK